jgi:hypothetical protein
MHRLLLAAFLAVPATANAGAACMGIADGLAAIDRGGFTVDREGKSVTGTIRVYVDDKGNWLAVYVMRDQVCIVDEGTDWGLPGKPA